ncbi:MAG: hypothetical protein FK730_08070 [Asgard group archaeon]|nr:hypothetical protein [Asgard group archaeon]
MSKIKKNLTGIKNPFAKEKLTIFSLFAKDSEMFTKGELMQGRNRYLFLLKRKLTFEELEMIRRIYENIVELADFYSYDDIANHVRDYFKEIDLLVYSLHQDFTLL